MENILKNKFFYIGFIIMFGVFFYVFKDNVFSFSTIGQFFAQKNMQIGDSYVRKDVLDDTPIGIITANLNIGKGTIDNGLYIDKALSTLNTSKLLVNVDIVSMIENAADKKVALETNIKQMEDSRDKLEDYAYQFLSMSQDNKNQADDCLNQKNQGDGDFFNGLNSNENLTLKDGLSTSTQYGPCYIKNRILANAYYKLYDKCNFYKIVLTSKIDLITQNQDQILENYKQFRDSNLEKLIAIRNQLNSYSANSGLDGQQ